MPSSERDRRLRAELADELGWYPADLDDESVAEHRRLAASPDTAPSMEHIARKYAHLRQEKRQRDVEAAGRAAVADLYDTVAASEVVSPKATMAPLVQTTEAGG